MFSAGFVERSSVARETHDAVCAEKEEEEEGWRAEEAEMRTFTAILKVKVIYKKKKREIKP